jgi:glycosyltransferase involved in cell wall biosynthesis
VGLTFWECDRPLLDRAREMDRLWVPSRHTRNAFRAGGIKASIRLIPWPIHVPVAPADGLPEGDVYNLDRRSLTTASLIRLARLNDQAFPCASPLLRPVVRRSADALLSQLRTPARAIARPQERALLCVAQDVPRKALPLLLSEWLEFKRRPEAGPWVLILKSSPVDPAVPAFAFVMRWWERVQALKRQLGVRRAGVFLWTGDLSAPDFARLLGSTFGMVTSSLGEGFCGPAALALALGKPLVAPRHTALADYVPPDYPYVCATRPAVVRFAPDPLDVYHPASSWQVPTPFSVADALCRLVTDDPSRRQEAVQAARRRVLRWCDPARIRRILAEEVLALDAGTRKSPQKAPAAGSA